MSGNVKGELFADYVRMIRGRKDVDWSARLSAEDLAYVERRTEPAEWYPMEVFERLGNAILAEMAGGSLEPVRMWGRASVPPLVQQHPNLIAEGDPMESLMRFHVYRSTFFDFPAIEVVMLTPEQAELAIDYGMGDTAEEAAVHQAMGFFEGLLAAAGAVEVEARLLEKKWAGDPRTLLSVSYALPKAGRPTR